MCETFIKKNIDLPDLQNTFLDGSLRKAIILKSSAIGVGTYQAGWKWSTHAGAITGKPSARHISYILSGAMIIENSQGQQNLVTSGEAFEVLENHDAWVVGNEPCIAIDFTILD